MRQQEECICRQCGFLMTWLTSAIYANHILICSEESIIVETAEGIICKIFILNYSVVCAWCSDKTDYVAGYGDERVRLCDTCVRDKKVMK